MVSGNRNTAAFIADSSSSAGSSYSGLPRSANNVISSAEFLESSPSLESILRSVASQSVQYNHPANPALHSQNIVTETANRQTAQAAIPDRNEIPAKGSAKGPNPNQHTLRTDMLYSAQVAHTERYDTYATGFPPLQAAQSSRDDILAHNSVLKTADHQDAQNPGLIARPTGPGTAANPTYASLLKSNRLMLGGIQLQKLNNGTEKMSFDISRVDPIDSVYGPCLLGWIMGARPPPPAIHDLIRRWGGNGISFITHASGWILFKFPSVAIKDKIKNGMKHTVLGRHVFLKEMPRCFNFGSNDVHLMPTWTQIHGLPPDCWNEDFLSNIGSRIGTPIHSDAYTHARMGLKFARLLVEVDMQQPLLRSLDILVDGKNIELNFIYEHEPRSCPLCSAEGKEVTSCMHFTTKTGRSRGRSRTTKHNTNAGRNQEAGPQHGHVPRNQDRSRTRNRTQGAQQGQTSRHSKPGKQQWQPSRNHEPGTQQGQNPSNRDRTNSRNRIPAESAANTPNKSYRDAVLGSSPNPEKVNAKPSGKDTILGDTPIQEILEAKQLEIDTVHGFDPNLKKQFAAETLQSSSSSLETSGSSKEVDDFTPVINRKNAKKERYWASLTTKKKKTHTIPLSKSIIFKNNKNTSQKDKGKRQTVIEGVCSEDPSKDLDDESLDTEYVVEGDPTQGRFWGNLEKGKTPTKKTHS